MFSDSLKQQKKRLTCLRKDLQHVIPRMDRIKGILAKYGEVSYFTDSDGKNYRLEISVAQWKKEEKRDFDKLIRFAHIKEKETGLPFDQVKDDATDTTKVLPEEDAGTGPENW